jgi:transposase
VSSLEERIARLEALVERQSAIIAEKDAVIERLQARVAELERKQGGSGSPPASPSSAARPEPSGRKPGGQPGHKGHRRELLQPTSTTECMPETCRGCGAALPEEPDANPLRHQVIDMPPVKPTVGEFRLHRIACKCGIVTCGQLPAGTPVGMMGPGLLALVGLLIASCHVSRRKVRALLRDVLNVDISLGALSESEEVVADAVAAPVEEARIHAVDAKVKHADGTTWYRAHAFRALWVLATKGVTVFSIFESATKDVLEAWMGSGGVLVSDRGSQLVYWDVKRRQICWAHLIRKFAWYAEQGGEAGQLGLALLGRAPRTRRLHHPRDLQAEHHRDAGLHRVPAPRWLALACHRRLVRAHPRAPRRPLALRLAKGR